MSDIKPFLDEDFLLENRVAKILYHDYAKHQPIIDYHNHLPPDQIANNKKFKSISEAWLYGDHYKWRAMRTLGIKEKYITGDGTDREKFQQWAATVPFTIRNPLFHWTHMELKNYFDVHEVLNEENADEIFNHCNSMLNKPEFFATGLLKQMNVEVVCSTDDPADSLEYHQAYAATNPEIKMFPAFRPDKAIMIENAGYLDYIDKLGQAANIEIKSYDDLLQALSNRIDYFDQNGCKVSDHGLSKVYAIPATYKELSEIFIKRLHNQILTSEETEMFMSGIMHELGKMYSDHGWVMQLHLGALRNNNQRMLRELGPDTGFDSIGDYNHAQDLSKFLDGLDNLNKLPKTILYNLNPRDNELMATMVGNFNDGSIKGKVQFGSGWWFLDQKDGMEKQMNTLSNMGLLSCFIGMLTDSRSFLSFPRHEYFRRILCNLIGQDVHNGELPNDEKLLGKIVADICYHNAKSYFNF